MHINHYLLPRKAIAILCTIASAGVCASNIPSLSGSSGYDEFRTSNGMVCRQAVGGGPQLQVGGTLSQGSSNDTAIGSRRDTNRDESGVFIQLVVPLGAPDG